MHGSLLAGSIPNSSRMRTNEKSLIRGVYITMCVCSWARMISSKNGTAGASNTAPDRNGNSRNCSGPMVFMSATRDMRCHLQTEQTPRGARGRLLDEEFAKIDEYQKKGDVASYEDGIAYLESRS